MNMNATIDILKVDPDLSVDAVPLPFSGDVTAAMADLIDNPDLNVVQIAELVEVWFTADILAGPGNVLADVLMGLAVGEHAPAYGAVYFVGADPSRTLPQSFVDWLALQRS